MIRLLKKKWEINFDHSVKEETMDEEVNKDGQIFLAVSESPSYRKCFLAIRTSEQLMNSFKMAEYIVLL